jgi:hypothetical protein
MTWPPRSRTSRGSFSAAGLVDYRLEHGIGGGHR